MGNKSRNRTNRQIKKALRNTTAEQRKASTQSSTLSLEFVKNYVEVLKPYELSRTNRLRTYQAMLRDDACYSGWELRTELVQETQQNGRFIYDGANTVSARLAEYFKHVMASMDGQTPRSVAGAACEKIFNGYAPFEIVTKEGTNKWQGYHTLSVLSYIDPLTVDPLKPFTTTKDGNSIVAIRQLMAAFASADGTNSIRFSTTGSSKEIDYRKIAMCSYSSTPSEPIGASPFDAAYEPWRIKRLIQEYAIVGVQKDMAGTPILLVPQALLDDAKEEGSLAWYTVEQLRSQMANLHAGDQAYMILPSDTYNESGSGQKVYDITFKGVDGSGKQHDLIGLMDQCSKAIHKVLGSINLVSAEQGTASYNSLSGAGDILLNYVKQDSRSIDDMWNKKVFPLLLRLNKDKFGDVDPVDIPQWRHGEASPVPLDELGKYLNRVARLIPCVPEVINKVLEPFNIPYRVPDDATPEDIREMLFTFIEPSKTGSGDGSSGAGMGSQGNSDTNTENAE